MPRPVTTSDVGPPPQAHVAPSITTTLHWTLRLAVAACFVGHGAFGQPLRPGDPGYDQLEGARLATNRARAHGWPRWCALRCARAVWPASEAPRARGRSDRRYSA